jgi:hypothetical protein
MREAYGQFYEAVGSATVCHEGDPVLTAHVLAAAATLDGPLSPGSDSRTNRRSY